MKRNSLFLLLTLIVVSSTTCAETITEQEALHKAQQVLKGKTLQAVRSQKAKARTEEASANETDLFFFNAENGNGFVIVSPDDRTVPILGYSDQGSIDLDNMPENLLYWLDSYREQMKFLDEESTSAKRSATRASRPAIAPLIKTTWGQDMPYKGQCPIYKNLNCVTGCVATAMAQLMYYYQYPAGSTALPAYQSGSYKLSVEELPATTFRWNKIWTSYSKDALGEPADAVAELLRYCGQAVAMDYSPSGSGSTDERLVYGMIHYFGYDKNARIISRAHYSQTQWEDLLYQELASGRPVVYSGTDASLNGHEFICDGYDGNGLFHLNWGWDGTANGYFVASLANYKTSRKGVFGSLDGYSIYQSAIIGLQPDTGEKAVPEIFSAVNNETATYTRASATDNFQNVTLKGQFVAKYRFEPSEYQIETGWGLYQGEECLNVFESKTIPFGKEGESFGTITYSSPDYNFQYKGQKTSVTNQFTFGSDLPAGTYQIRQVYRPVGETAWRICNPYSTTVSYLVASIEEQAMTLRATEAKESYIVNDVWTSDDPAQGEPFSVTVNLTNTGDTNQELIYLYFDGELVTTLYASIGAGETGNATLTFVPLSYGSSKTLSIKNIQKEELWSGTVDETREMEDGFFDEATNYYEIQDDRASVILKTVNVLDDGKLVVPPTVSHRGKDYTVIGISGSSQTSVCKYPDELREVVLPSTIRSIGEFTFYFCMSLSSLTWDHFEESALTDIGGNAFTSCTHLKALALPKHLSSIGISALAGCISLPAFTLDDTSDSYSVVDGLLYNKDQTILVNCPAGKVGSVVLPSTVKTLDSNAFYNCTQVTDITLPEGLDSIGFAVFVGCSSLKTLTIPASTRVMGYGNFTGCTSLESIEVAPGNAHYTSLDGALVEDGFSLLAYPNKKGVRYEVPDDIKVLEHYSCCWTDLQEITLPQWVNLGYLALGYCHDLVSVTTRQSRPIDIDNDSFSKETYEKATLYVPEGCTEIYRSKEGWKNFVHIVEMDDTGISAPNAEDKSFDVYDMNGRKVRTAVTTLDDLPKGLYIVHSAKGRLQDKNGKKVIR